MRRLLIFAISVFLLASANVGNSCLSGDLMINGTQDSRRSFPPLGPYRIHGRLPLGFEDFCAFTLELRAGETQSSAKPNKKGELVINGSVETGTPHVSEDLDKITSDSAGCKDATRYPFERAVLKQDCVQFNRVAFRTRVIHGVNYEFKGRFFEKSKWLNDMYVDLEGSLAKFKDGKKIAEADVQMVSWRYE